MPRPEKVAVVEEVRDELRGNAATLLTEYRGLSVGDLAALRRELHAAGARYRVVKNTLARIAARDAGFDGLDELLTGPTALTFCGDDPVAPAKALRRFAREHPELVVKGGLLEGRVVDAATADSLADLASREELLARLAGMMYAALANTARLFQEPIARMARLVAALEDKGGAPAEPGPAAEPAAAEPAPSAAEEAPAPAEPTGEQPAADAAEEVAEEDELVEVTADNLEAEEVDEASPADSVATTVADAADSAASVAERAGETVADAVEGAGEAVGGPVERAAESVASTAEGVAGAVASAAETVSDAVESAAGETDEAGGGGEDEEAEEAG